MKPAYEELEQRIKELEKEVSEQKQSEEALRESEDRYKTLSENSLTGIYILQDGRFVFVNDRFAEIHGYTAQELLGKENLSLIHPDEREVIKQRVSQRLKGVPVPRRYELQILKKDGKSSWCEIMVTPIQYRGRPAIMGNLIDITEKKQSEDSLQREKEKFRILVEESPVGVSLIAKNGDYLYVNPKSIEMFGYTLTDIPTGREWFRKAYPDKEYRKKVVSIWKNDCKVIEPGEAMPQTFRVTCKDGSEKVINFRSVVTTEPVSYLVICEDITEKERLQAQLLHSQKMDAIGTLAGGIAHLFNNNLTAITGYTGLLKANFPDNKKIMEYAQCMKESAYKMVNLTSQLQSYARIREYHPEIISLSDLVKETLPMMSHTLNPDVRIETDPPRDTLNVEADHSQMQMVLSAIVSNSNDAIEGEGRIRIIVRNEEVLEGHPELRPGAYVCMIVEDDGKGMDEDTRNRIFDPFFTTYFIGRGLGMAAVYGIVKNHNGSISVESEVGVGTTVNIYLPSIKNLEIEEAPL
ncbi:MAG: PAS domain S-box protein [Thermodesulfobacteriota bacterium]|nr:PAS domain S-box protein [Thermodesulfobacteriota bacterium]